MKAEDLIKEQQKPFKKWNAINNAMKIYREAEKHMNVSEPETEVKKVIDLHKARLDYLIECQKEVPPKKWYQNTTNQFIIGTILTVSSIIIGILLST